MPALNTVIALRRLLKRAHSASKVMSHARRQSFRRVLLDADVILCAVQEELAAPEAPKEVQARTVIDMEQEKEP